MSKILITSANFSFDAELNDNQTAKEILETLPIESYINKWGNEIYFNITKKIPLDAAAKKEIEVGDLAYWPEGPAFCIFFGPTPASTGSKPMAVSPVNVFGKITTNIEKLKDVRDAEKIKVELVS
ncbi:MAG: cyclophilin-like fold protein [Bacteroidota bacterium]